MNEGLRSSSVKKVRRSLSINPSICLLSHADIFLLLIQSTFSSVYTLSHVPDKLLQTHELLLSLEKKKQNLTYYCILYNKIRCLLWKKTKQNWFTWHIVVSHSSINIYWMNAWCTYTHTHILLVRGRQF